jgi:hypothetical protein
MSSQIDPWDAMVQNDDFDEDYIPTGVDGIDDDLDDYRDIDEDYASDDDGLEVLGLCTLSFTCMPQLNSGLVAHTDVEYGDDGEPNTATVDPLQELVANRAGSRAVRLVLQHRQAYRQQADPEDEDDEDDYDFYTSFWGSMRGLERAGDNWYPKVTEPQPTGVKLLRSGDFGKARNRLGTPRNSNIYSRLRRMGLQQRTVDAAVDLKHNLIPNTHGTTVAAYYSNIYVAQFSPGASHAMLFLLWQLYSLRLPKMRLFTTRVVKVWKVVTR